DRAVVRGLAKEATGPSRARLSGASTKKLDKKGPGEGLRPSPEIPPTCSAVEHLPDGPLSKLPANLYTRKEITSMSLSSSLRHIRWRALFFSFACVLAFVFVPLIVGFVNYGSKVKGDAAVVDRAAYTGQLPTPTYDPAKRIAVIMASLSGPEITDV